MFLRNCELGIFVVVVNSNRDESPEARSLVLSPHHHISLIPEAKPSSVPRSALATAWTEDMLQFPVIQSHTRNVTERFLPWNTLQSALTPRKSIVLVLCTGCEFRSLAWRRNSTLQAWQGSLAWSAWFPALPFELCIQYYCGTEAFIFQNSVLLTYRVCSPFWTSSPLFVPLYCRSPSPLAALQWQSLNKTFERYNYHD